jgi:iron complex outermembrane receptor protein
MDYYNINIINAITLPATQTIINNCVDAPGLNQQFCGLVTRVAGNDPSRAFNIQTVQAQFLNAAALRTHGVDFEMGYGHDVAEWTQHLGPLLDRLDGRLAATIYANWTQANRTVPFQQFPNIQNINEGRTGIPTERGTIDLRYFQGPLTLGIRGRYVSRSALFNRDATQVEHCETLSPCQVPAEFYTDLDFNYKLATHFGAAEIYGGVKNIANTKIPYGGFTTSAEYEIFGTTGFIGFRIKE